MRGLARFSRSGGHDRQTQIPVGQRVSIRRLFLVLLAVSLLALGGCLDGVVQDATAPGQPDESTPTPTPTIVDETATPSPTATAHTATPTPDGELAVHYLDVGQADATIVEFPNGETMLVDSGDWTQDGEDVLAALDRRGIGRIDHLVATHPHADHIGGHEAVIDELETDGAGIGAAYDSGLAHTSGTFEEYLDAVERHDVDLFTVQAGDDLAVGNATVTFVNPAAAVESEDLHENSVSLVVDYGETEFLFTGDAEDGTETRIREAWASTIDADVYQAGHHGSRTSSSSAFLDAVQPRLVVISSALDSQYGHPHNETLAAFADRGYETYWTAVHGTVTVRSDGTGVVVETDHDATTNATELRSERERPPDPQLHPTGFVGGASIPG